MQNAIDPAALTAQPTKEIDFDGDEVELEDYWTVDYSVPKKAMAKVGLKMTFNEAGEAVFEEREDFVSRARLHASMRGVCACASCWRS